jgi:diguanylate cyclase (GGDEF)-like protein
MPVVRALLRLARRPATRAGRALLGLAAVTTAAAAICRLGDDGVDRFPSVAAVLGLLGAAVGALALMVFLYQQIRERAVSLLFEAVLCVAAIGLFPWAMAMNSGSPVGSTVRWLPVAADAVVVAIGLHLLRTTKGTDARYAYVVSAFAVLLAADVVTASGIDGGGALPQSMAVVQLIACCALALVTILPSVGQPGARPASSSSRLGPGRIAAPLGLTLVAPALFALQAVSGQAPSLGVVLGGTSVVAFLVAVYLVRQVQEGARAEYRAYHDPLTGLPHRAMFHDRLEEALEDADRTDTKLGVMFLDLDRFKMINDSLGHAVGDQLLQRVAERLQSALRQSDVVARMGGDEFMVLLPTVSADDDCIAVADKVLSAFARPFVVGDRSLRTSTSIGIAMFPEHGTDADTLAMNADLAMYRAKANGRNRYSFYASDMGARARLKHSLGHSLRAALEDGGLRLEYQPKIGTARGDVTGLEALARWSHPHLGPVPPTAFVALAEETGLIGSLGEWVLDTACGQIGEWLRRDSLEIPVAINVSAREFAHAHVAARVEAALARHDVPPRLLELEITESIFIDDLERASEALYTLRDMGVRCYIDDFGTGYSGLTYLSRLPIYGLKIDQSFVDAIGWLSGEQIVDAVIAMARGLGMKIVAEGVETPEQAEFLVNRGCNELQGRLYCPPLPAPDVIHRVRSIARRTPSPAPVEPVESSPASGAASADIAALLVAVCTTDQVIGVDVVEITNVLDSLGISEPCANLVGDASPVRGRPRSPRGSTADASNGDLVRVVGTE